MPVSQRVIAAYLSQRLSVGGAAATAPANTVAPAVTGTATVGQTLSTTDGTWTGTAPIVYTYQWQRAGVNIGSATNSTYVLVSADAGSAVRCVVTATNAGGSASANSNATAAVASVPANTVAPVASGTATVGSTLSTTDGTWTGSPTPTFTYQWQRAGVNIGGATSSTYLLVTADAGTAVRCVVTGTNTTGNASANSNAISVAALTYAQVVLADSPVAYWKFNEGSGTTITDYGSAAKNLTTHASPTLSNSGPMTGETCMTCVAASSQYADTTGATNVLHPGDTFTIEFWFKPTVTNIFQDIVSDDAGGYIRVNMQNSARMFLTKDTGDVAHTSAQTDTTAFHHWVVTKSGSTTVWYLDGSVVTVADANQTFTLSSVTVAVGRRQSNGSAYMSGSIGHVAIYNTALSAGRVSAHFAAKT